MAYSSNRIAWTYTDNTGQAFRVSALKELTDQGVVGGGAATGAVPGKPRGLKMRTVQVVAGSISRMVPVYDQTTWLSLRGAAGTAVTIQSNGAEHAGVTTNLLHDERMGKQTLQAT